jgi:hypothetical protein
VSLDLLVILAADTAPNWNAWAQALSQTHTPATFTQPVDLSQHTGFLPVLVNGRASGFYFLREPYPELAVQYPAVAKVHIDNPIVYSLSFGGYSDECAAAFLSASALVSRFHGLAFDPQEGAMMSAKQLTEAASQCLMLPRHE